MNFNTLTLSSGLRIIHFPSPSEVIYCGLAVHAGTRHEAPGQEGLAHFCEHLTFKGTHRRTAVQIINALEGVGGELNAFTGKEDTTFYAATTRPHLRRTVDVLCDIVFCSEYPEHEIEKECEVVCDEIESYEDSPAELIFDEFENILFQGHPLGHNILGSAERVRSYRQADAQAFTRKYYRPENAVFFVSGQVDFEKTAAMLEKILAPIADNERCRSAVTMAAPDPVAAPMALQPAPTLLQQKRSTHQAHVMIGARTFAASDPRRWSLYLLNNILGGPGMNSRLNFSLRERRGLVYTVESTMATYSDTGLWAIYFGCDQADVTRCRRLAERELCRLAERPLSESQLRQAKQQLHGQLAIAADNREQFTLDLVKSYLHEDRVRNLESVLAHVDGLTARQLQQAASELFDTTKTTTLIYE